MMTVNQVSKLTGVSIRMLHHYDKIGLLPATKLTESNYRLYDEEALERLQMILLYNELNFPLKEIANILNNPNFDKTKAINKQIELLESRRDRLNNIIIFAKGIKKMDKVKFNVFKKEAKEKYCNTEAYKEYESKHKTDLEEKEISIKLMDIFSEFNQIKDQNPNSVKAQSLVKKLQDFITVNYYTCTDVILELLGQMYCAEGEMKTNIDTYAGQGTATFVSEAIKSKFKK